MADHPKDRIDDRTFIRRVLIALGLATLFFLLWYLRSLILMLFGAVVVATVFRALADRIARFTSWREGVSLTLAIAIIFGLIAGFTALFGQQIAQQADVLRDSLPLAWRSFEERIGDIGLGDQLRQLVETIRQGSGSFSYLGSAILSVGNAIAEVLVVIFGGIFLAAQPRFYKSGVIKLVPHAQRAVIGEAMDESEQALRLWLKGQLIAMVVVGALTGIALWALGLQSALVLGLLAGLLEFIPFIGPILAAVPAILLALAVSPDLALWVALVYLVVQQFEGYLLTPLVQQYAVDLPSVVLLFSLVGLGMLFGTLGVFLAAPLTVVIYVLVKRLYVIEALHTPTPIPGEDKR